MPLDIDHLIPEAHLIDLTTHSQGDFGGDEFIMSFIYDDILLIEYIDLTSDGDGIIRNGIVVPVNSVTKAWRKGRVILAGPKVQYTAPGDIVMFPNDKGLSVSRMPVIKDGKEYSVKFGIFLNEDRLFGKCKMKDEGNTDTA
jgi:hypothetical protein